MSNSHAKRAHMVELPKPSDATPRLSPPAEQFRRAGVGLPDAQRKMLFVDAACAGLICATEAQTLIRDAGVRWS